jgi:tight adherence protein B
MVAAISMTFIAVFLGTLATFFGVTAIQQSPEAELKKRLRQMAEGDDERPARVSATKLIREVSPTEQYLFSLPLLSSLNRLVMQAGLQMKTAEFLPVMALASLGSFLLVFLAKGNALLALATAAATTGMFLLYLRHRRQRRQQKFTEQLPDALTMIARSLRAGHSLAGAMELLGQELADPAGALFRRVYEQQKLGMRINDALTKMLENMESLDLRFFVTIITINSEVGGNLAEILEKLADTIRARLQIRRQVSVYTAQGRLSGYILAVLPVVTFIGLYLLLPGYLDVFFKEQKPQIILAGAAGMEVIGFFVIRKIIDIKI